MPSGGLFTPASVVTDGSITLPPALQSLPVAAALGSRFTHPSLIPPSAARSPRAQDHVP